jgi:uncharacterized protein with GYD domain
MATFVSLINWTEQGIANFRDTTKRFGAFEDVVRNHGGRVVDFYWTIGQYDLVGVIETPDDETQAAILLELGALGNVRTTTLRAFTRDEMESIIAKIS